MEVRGELQPRPGEAELRLRQGSREKGKGQTTVAKGTVLCCYVPLAEQDRDSLRLVMVMGEMRFSLNEKKKKKNSSCIHHPCSKYLLSTCYAHYVPCAHC